MILTRDKAFTTVFSLITITDKEKNQSSIGTGTFVCKSEDELYLVTASHVANTTNNTTKVIFSDVNNNCLAFDLLEFNKNLTWKHHNVADLAVLKIHLTGNLSQILKNHFLPLNHINLEKKCVSRDVELTTIGFPCGLGMQTKFSPLTFRSYSASSFISIGRGPNQVQSEVFCLENPSVGGYSGAPVFDLGYSMVNGQISVYGQKTICYGFISATLGDQTGGKIALVTPAYYLLDLLNDNNDFEVKEEIGEA